MSVANATLRWSSDKGWVERGAGNALGEPPETASLPTLAQLTSAEQRWADREEDITTVGGDPFEVGQVFARRWTERITDSVHLQHLSTEYPPYPAPHRRRAAALRRPLRTARPQGRPDRRARPLCHPRRVLARDRRPHRRRTRPGGRLDVPSHESARSRPGTPRANRGLSDAYPHSS
ncbi:hypothetical protein GCM10020000_60130 [Streptomyces olivoverticillatus]